MTRHSLANLLALAGVLAVAIVVFLRTDGPAERGSTSSPGSPSGEAAAFASKPELVPSSLAKVSDSSGDQTQVASARELVAREDPQVSSIEDLWLSGQVILPEGANDGEATLVVRPRGRGGLAEVRVPIQGDGRFRTALDGHARRWQVDLESRFLYLERAVRLRAEDLQHPLVLEPVLGGALDVELVPPVLDDSLATELRAADLRLTLSVSFLSPEPVGEDVRYPAGDVGEDLVARFSGMTPGTRYRVWVMPRATGSSAPRLAHVSLRDVMVEAGDLERVELPVPFGGRVFGHVLDEEHRPLAGAKVRSARSMDFNGTRTDSEGAFELGGVGAGPLFLEVTYKGIQRDFHDLGMIAAGEKRDGIELLFDRGGAIAGRVEWPDGEPAAGAWIRIAPSEGLLDRFEPSSDRADREGRFEIAGLEATHYDVECSARPRAGDSRSALARLEDVAIGSTALVLVLECSLAIRGRVVDETGVPVEGFRVKAMRREDDGKTWEEKAIDRGFQDDQGIFLFDGLRPGTWFVSAQGKDEAIGPERRVELVDGDAEVVLVAPRGVRILGRVLDEDGGPVEGALVVERRGFGAEEGKSTRTDVSGAFELAGLDAGQTTLVASAPGYAMSLPLALELLMSQSYDGVVLELRQSGRLEIELASSVGITARRELSVFDLEQPYAGALAAFAGAAHSVRTNAQGRASVVLDPGRYSVVLADAGTEGAENSRALVVEATIRTGETTHVVLGSSAPDVRITGAVTSVGQPVRGVTIVFQSGGFTLASAETNQLGTYAVDLPPGAYDLGPIPLGWSVRVEVPSATEHRLDLDLPGASLSGMVLDANETPVAFARLVLVRYDAPAPARSSFTGHGGGFSFQYLDPGQYALVASRLVLAEAMQGERLGITILDDVIVGEEPSGLLEVRATENGHVVVQAQDSGGWPVAGVTVELVAPDPLAPALPCEGLSMRTSNSGTAHLPPFSAGTVRLRARLGERCGPVTEVVVVPGATAEAHLLLPD